MHKNVPLALSAAVFVVVAGTGCSSPAATSGEPQSIEQIAADAKDRGHDWQATVLGDGNVTLAEYDEGHRRNLACLDGAGIQYSEPERNIPNGYEWLYDMTWPSMDDPKGQKVSEKCFDENLGEVSLAMSAWGDWETDSALLAAVLECVSASGFEIDASAKNLRDVWLEGSDEGLTKETVAGCAQDGMLRLYPGVSYGIGF